MIILGINLSQTMQTNVTNQNSDKFLSVQTTIAVIVAKMIVMPIIGICSVLLLRHYVWDIPEGKTR